MASATPTSVTKQFSSTRRKSCDTVCSTNSSCVFHKRKLMHPFASSVRPYVLKNTNSTVTQRVLSARLLKLRSLQTQLNDANFHLSEVQRENRTLKNLQNRQDKALSKYEGRNADLPKLLQAHEEEIRVLVTKNKHMRRNMKETIEQQKVKEEELLNLRDQLKSLTLLTKTKNLGERHTLMEQIEELKETLKSSDEKVNLLNRKLLLESKNYKHRLNAEMMKTREVQKELVHAMNEIDRLGGLLEGRGKIILNGHRKRFASVHQKQTGSLTSLGSDSLIKDDCKTEKTLEQSLSDVALSNESVKGSENESHSDNSDIKLETFASEKESKVSFASEVMVAPSENIKARLSAKLKRDTSDLSELNQSFEKVSISESKNPKSHINGAHKLVKLSHNGHIQNGLKENNNVVESLANNCKDMKTTVKSYGSVVDQHKDDFQSVQTETEKLLSSLRETDVLNSKLRFTNFLTADKFEIPDQDLDLAKEIWNEEFVFKQKVNSSKQDLEEDEGSILMADKNGNVLKKEVKVAFEKKHKLLATLRAIDNGDDIDGITFSGGHHKNHLKQLEQVLDN